MPNFKSDIVTLQDAVNYSAKSFDGNRTGGLILRADPVYTLLGTEIANDTIQLFDLPPNAEIIPELSNVTCSADPGTTLTLHVGDGGGDGIAADPDRYANGIVLSAGGKVEFASGTMPAALVTRFKPTGKTRIFATVASANTLTATVKLLFQIAYRIKG